MTTTFEKLSSNKVKLGFTVEPEKFDEGLQTAYRKLVKQITIPGFRRGKAPMRIIESHYGPSVFYEDAFEAIFPKSTAPPSRSTASSPSTAPSWTCSRSVAVRS